MFEKDVEKYRKFFSEKYNKLLNEAISITSHSDLAQDILHDNYIKIIARIAISGFTGTNYHGYTWRSIQNDWRVLKNRDKIREFVDIDIDHDGEDNYNDREKAEWILYEEDQHQKAREDYYQQVEYIVGMLFKYVETHYDDKATYLFITYYDTGMTYKELAVQNEYSITYVSNTIKPIKKDIKDNFIDYLKLHYNDSGTT